MAVGVDHHNAVAQIREGGSQSVTLELRSSDGRLAVLAASRAQPNLPVM
jgi:hypothetical protein